MVGIPCIREDGGRVKCDDVDTTHLLCNHDGKGSDVGPTDSGDGEGLAEPSEVVGVSDKLVLDAQLCMDILNIPSHLDCVVAQNQHTLPGIGISVLHVPSRRLRAEVDQTQKGHGWYERGTKHQSPVVRCIVHCEVYRRAK
jgi:hypothetical protein